MDTINEENPANDTPAADSVEAAVVRLLNAYVIARATIDRLGANLDRLLLNQLAAVSQPAADGGTEVPGAT